MNRLDVLRRKNNRGAKKSKASPPLTHKDRAPSLALVDLCQTLNLPSKTLEEMTKTLQRDFLRKPEIERWHMKEVPYKKEDNLARTLQETMNTLT